MDSTVIVAIPSVDDKVYKISSEKIPHLTLCFLGDQSGSDQLIEIVEFVQHAASQLGPFGMSVDYRGTLGADAADVIFFEQGPFGERIKEFRANLLKNDAIRRAYESAEQFEGWTPHLTLGYPATPAREDESDYPGINYVHFDRIAVWMGDFEGPEFRLKHDFDTMEVSMNDIATTTITGATAVGDILAQSGVKGMRWGITTKDRATQRTPTDAVVTQKKLGKFAKSTGGKNQPLHEDAVKALTVRQKAKSSTTDALSNAEIQTAVNRMQLEQRYAQLNHSSDRRSAGVRFVTGLLGQHKELKYRDMHEESGEKTRNAIKQSLAAKKSVDQALAAAAAGGI